MEAVHVDPTDLEDVWKAVGGVEGSGEQVMARLTGQRDGEWAFETQCTLRSLSTREGEAAT